MHVDEYIEGEYNKDNYARWFLMLHRLNACLQYDFGKWIKQYKLFCEYEGGKYRVTGASRLGDIWLAKDFNRESGYDLRVDLEKCSKWSDI